MPSREGLRTHEGAEERYKIVAILMRCAYPLGCFQPQRSNHSGLPSVRKGGPMRTIHVYRAARDYFVDGIYWGDDEEGVKFYLEVTGVPPDEITKALEEIAQEGTSLIQQQ
jgi:hypothetical protein